MADDPQKFLEVALEATKKAEPVFRKYFGNAPGVSEKVDQGMHRSPVTDVDKEIETLITSHLLSQFSTHSISGEEFSPQHHSSPYTWYIDPIDGTINYIRGLPFASISLGLWKEDVPIVAVVSDPMHNVTYSALHDKGAFRNGTQKLSVSSVSKFGEAVGGSGRAKALGEDPLLQRVAKAAYRGREYGGAALELCSVAEGKLDFWISERTKIYDVAAGMLMVTEAGGTVTDWEGNPYTLDSANIVASNGKIHTELLQALKK
ncbi:MAG: hypothetical protein A2849_03970 [Candidatus Taylorbacteria bacterium RIFCSPHIGHO2_01_FULL_51_15]|uniref:Inositol-1-monophosphatase n=1 Tax=Candidatus Taylorbacteria bacterium RIFCSPHIGHO2_01_FULL_51_15 TaxID=1802304 RepID=A0A1G2MCB2_9BACT|nr:MAG: hypothetical protein A2849_03970 [Candidatus Taylorbacteria bacterium RIFCSPHIGHO2_01_FULL_51_15]